jgi:hypothetical protein
MNKTLISLDDAIRFSLPLMINNKNALNAIVELMADFISSNNFDVSSNIIETLIGKGDFDEFSINIHEFHGIFWISAPEFDDEGYFISKEDAIEFAVKRFEPFITNYLKN